MSRLWLSPAVLDTGFVLRFCDSLSSSLREDFCGLLLATTPPNNDADDTLCYLSVAFEMEMQQPLFIISSPFPYCPRL